MKVFVALVFSFAVAMGLISIKNDEKQSALDQFSIEKDSLAGCGTGGNIV